MILRHFCHSVWQVTGTHCVSVSVSVTPRHPIHDHYCNCFISQQLEFVIRVTIYCPGLPASASSPIDDDTISFFSPQFPCSGNCAVLIVLNSSPRKCTTTVAINLCGCNSLLNKLNFHHPLAIIMYQRQMSIDLVFAEQITCLTQQLPLLTWTHLLYRKSTAIILK